MRGAGGGKTQLELKAFLCGSYEYFIYLIEHNTFLSFLA